MKNYNENWIKELLQNHGKNNWKSEITRSGVRDCYHAFYKYADAKGTQLDYMLDVLMGDPKFAYLFESDEYIAPEWHRRFYGVYVQRKTGLPIFTIPAYARYKASIEFVKNKNIISPAALREHNIDLNKIEAIAKQRNYHRYAKQVYLSSSFRGSFYAVSKENRQLKKHVMLVQFIKGESFFRTRHYEFVFNQAAHENNSAFKERVNCNEWGHYTQTDGAAAIGVIFGSVFTDNENIKGIDVRNFNFIKGRNISSFTAHIKQRRIEFDLAVKFHDLKAIYNLLNTLV